MHHHRCLTHQRYEQRSAEGTKRDALLVLFVAGSTYYGVTARDIVLTFFLALYAYVTSTSICKNSNMVANIIVLCPIFVLACLHAIFTLTHFRVSEHARPQVHAHLGARESIRVDGSPGEREAR
jgi:hypothetical protein